MESLISICIPTFNRPELLREAIGSCISQAYRPIEILIGDDSANDDTRRLIQEFRLPDGISIQYERNSPALRQSGNVNRLFDRATGSRLMLLHDDDLLCPGGLDLLTFGWRDFSGVRCIYGKQYVVDADGVILWERTEELNEKHFHSGIYSGRQQSSVRAGLTQMPNNGYLIESSLARKIKYRSERDIGQAVDADFSIRVGLDCPPGSLVFLADYVSKYRLTPGSILRTRATNYNHHLLFEYVSEIRLEPSDEPAREILLAWIGTAASLDAAMAGEVKLALRILFSKYYKRPLLSKWTLFRLLCIMSPRIGAELNKLLH